MANDLSMCFFTGNLGGDPEVKEYAGGKLVKFSIAVGKEWKDKSGEEKKATEWVRCVAFGKLAEAINDNVSKGSKVMIEGRWKTNQWEKDGIKQYTTECLVNICGLVLQTKANSKPLAFDQRPPVEDDGDIPF